MREAEKNNREVLTQKYGRQSMLSEQDYPAPSPRMFQESDRNNNNKDAQSSDERIKAEAQKTLTGDPYLDAHNLIIEVREGIVTLKGSVHESSMSHRAEECIQKITGIGIKDIDNQIVVQKVNRSTGREREEGQQTPLSKMGLEPKPQT